MAARRSVGEQGPPPRPPRTRTGEAKQRKPLRGIPRRGGTLVLAVAGIRSTPAALAVAVRRAALLMGWPIVWPARTRDAELGAARERCRRPLPSLAQVRWVAGRPRGEVDWAERTSLQPAMTAFSSSRPSQGDDDFRGTRRRHGVRSTAPRMRHDGPTVYAIVVPRSAVRAALRVPEHVLPKLSVSVFSSRSVMLARFGLRAA